jgi:hypothetical protein
MSASGPTSVHGTADRSEQEMRGQFVEAMSKAVSSVVVGDDGWASRQSWVNRVGNVISVRRRTSPNLAGLCASP